MSAESDHRQDDDPLESSELARRLRRMEWPPAPPEVKARVLERVIERADAELGRGSDDGSRGRANG